MCRAVSRQAVYQRGRPRTKTHEALTTLAAVSLRDWVEYASHPSHLVCSLPVSHVSHPTIIIQSHRARAVRARGARGSTTPNTVATDAGPQDIEKPIRPVSNVRVVWSFPGSRAEFYLLPPCVCGSRAVSDLCRTLPTCVVQMSRIALQRNP